MNVKFETGEFITSVRNWQDCPDLNDVPEIALVGRSNVGKSSFINSMVGQKGLAKTSNTPGKTRLMNYFWIDNPKLILVDLPGYGYAKVSKTEQAHWQKHLTNYLLKRESLIGVLQLVDSRVGAKESDIQMYDWLSANEKPSIILMTKIDKLKQGELAKSKASISDDFGLSQDSIIPYSSIKPNTLNGRSKTLHAIQNLIQV